MVIMGRVIPAIEPDLYNDEIRFSDDTLCRWADRRFAKANQPHPMDRHWVRSTSGLWIATEPKAS